MKHFLLLLFISSTALAEPGWYLSGQNSKDIPAVESCLSSIKNFSQQNLVDKRCFFHIYSLAKPEHMTETTHYLVVAYKNSLFINQKIEQVSGFRVERRVIAGKSSTLKNIQYVNISDDAKSVAVIDQGAVKIFGLDRHGNIGPSRQVSIENLGAIDSVHFHPDGKNLVLISSTESKLSLVSLKYDSRHPAQAGLVNSVSFLEGEELRSPKDVAFSKNRGEIYVLDQKREEILVYKVGSSTPSRSLGRSQLYSPSSFQWSEAEGEFTVVNLDRSKVKIKDSGRDDEGH